MGVTEGKKENKASLVLGKKKNSKKETADYLPGEGNEHPHAPEKLSHTGSLCAYLADQLGYSQGSIDLL